MLTYLDIYLFIIRLDFCTHLLIFGHGVRLARGRLGVRIPSTDRLNSSEHIVTGPLPNAQPLVCVSLVLGDEHYKRMSRVTVGVARKRTLTVEWPLLPSTDQILQPFTGKDDISI